jgi:hypothetical protein
MWSSPGRIALSDATDPLELLVEAIETDDPSVRSERYRAALSAAGGTQAAEIWHAWYLRSVEARALCGLARDRQVPIEQAAEAVQRSVDAGEACASLFALAQAYASLSDHQAVITTIRALPKTCFRTTNLAVWRFELWDLRVWATFELGRVGEALAWAERVVGWMEPEQIGMPESRDLLWAPPYRTVAVLLTLAEGDHKSGARARQLLLTMSARVDLEEWFPKDTVSRVMRQVSGPR